MENWKQQAVLEILKVINSSPLDEERKDSASAGVLRLADESTKSNSYGRLDISQNPLIQEVKQMMINLNIKGSLRERKNGLLELRSMQFGSIYGRTQDEIQEKIMKKLHEIQSHLKRETPKKSKSPLLSTFYEQSYLPYKKNKNLAESTLKGIEYNFKYIMDQGFDKPLSSYTAAEIEAFLFSIEKTRTRQIMQGLLNNIFKRAVALSLIKENPCELIEKMEHETNEGSALSFAEQNSFFETVFSSKKLSHTQKCYLTFVYLTGARRNEALAVTTDDVDFENKVLHLKGTKTDGSNREIPLFRVAEKLLLGMETNQGMYFPISEKKADEAFGMCMKKHKLHDLRHTFGTIQICCNKVDVKTVSLWMGHSTLHTTLTIYTHPEQLDKANFLRGDLSENEKTVILQSKYAEILRKIEDFLEDRTQIVPKF